MRAYILVCGSVSLTVCQMCVHMCCDSYPRRGKTSASGSYSVETKDAWGRVRKDSGSYSVEDNRRGYVNNIWASGLRRNVWDLGLTGRLGLRRGYTTGVRSLVWPVRRTYGYGKRVVSRYDSSSSSSDKSGSYSVETKDAYGRVIQKASGSYRLVTVMLPWSTMFVL